MRARVFLNGAMTGAGLMYCFDPVHGARRRARLSERLVRIAGELEHEVGAGVRDLEHRLAGVVHDATQMLGERDTLEPQVLEARVRAALGRVCSHPHAVTVLVADQGAVELSGDVLDDEAQSILSAVRRVRGVRAIDDDLTRHAEYEKIPALQGRRITRHPPVPWTDVPAARLIAGTIVSGLAAWIAPKLTLRIALAIGAGIASRAAARRKSLRKGHARETSSEIPSAPESRVARTQPRLHESFVR